MSASGTIFSHRRLADDWSSSTGNEAHNVPTIRDPSAGSEPLGQTAQAAGCMQRAGGPHDDEVVKRARVPADDPRLVATSEATPWTSTRARCPDTDMEAGKTERKLVLLGPLYTRCGAEHTMYFCLSSVSVLLEEFARDSDATRFALVVTLLGISVFCPQLAGKISPTIGPVAQCHENSVFYLAAKPAPKPAVMVEEFAQDDHAVDTVGEEGGANRISKEDRQEFMRIIILGRVRARRASSKGQQHEVRARSRHLAVLEAAGVTEGAGECLEDKSMHFAVEEMYGG
ncbi:hypothetical protein B0H17DRAFT_1205255 [Mycena rosella]|uniref:Uncharacterized protein n=1 Tax=Mycena rosella TaxID=1033263 RepID=A0AAD7D8X5_MYCRO|nr:hypothetical protein B0H17DRAFT_1205255 [Mycena rosella]